MYHGYADPSSTVINGAARARGPTMSLALLVQVGGIPGAPGACSIIEGPCFRVWSHLSD
jgi:hypothetical protein